MMTRWLPDAPRPFAHAALAFLADLVAATVPVDDLNVADAAYRDQVCRPLPSQMREQLGHFRRRFASITRSHAARLTQ